MTEKTIAAVTAIVEKRRIRTLPTVESVTHLETHVAIDKIYAAFAVEGKYAKLAILHAYGAIAVAQIFALVPRVTKVAILAVPPVIGVFAVFVSRTDVVRNRRLFEEFPHLRKYFLGCIESCPRRICGSEPDIAVPHRMWAIFGEHGDDGFPRAIACALMQCPMLPKGTEKLHTHNRMQIWCSFYVQFLSQCHLLLGDGKSFAGDGACSSHGNILRTYRCNCVL